MPFHKRREWSGPKEWRPPLHERWVDSPLLSPEENSKLRALSYAAKNTAISAAEATWLHQMVMKLSRCAPDDYSFPQRLALFNPILGTAYAIRYQETRLIEWKSFYKGPFIGANLFMHTIQAGPSGAVVVIRPYIKVNSVDCAESLASLRASTIAMTVDGDKVLNTPIDEHLILQDGSFPRKNRWKYLRTLGACVFGACPIDAAGNAYPAEENGVSCQNGSVISIGLSRDEAFRGEVTLTTGLVAALYTARGAQGALGVAP